ncbi:hypothetical protein F66182_2849 [Fusarium sp. NRRL 66182]|nr:hypothetical protein F66182_2849 [Fusarium sp. NRRL 66182]
MDDTFAYSVILNACQASLTLSTARQPKLLSTRIFRQPGKLHYHAVCAKPCFAATCPGYDRPLALRFHGEPGHSLVRDRPSSSQDPAQPLESNKGPSWGRARARNTEVVVRQPQPSFEEESIAYFLHEYCVLPGPGVFRGHLDFLRGMYDNASRSSCIRPATLATAYMTLSRYYKSSTLYVAARNHYGAALRAVNKDLSAADRPLKDETLASLMLLGMIEDIECQGQTTKAVHMAGIAKLYEVVGHHVLLDVDTNSLNGWIFTSMQLPSLSVKDNLDCLIIPDVQLDTDSHAIRLALVVTRIGQFYRAAKSVTASDERSLSPKKKRDVLASLIQQAMGIAAELANIERNKIPTQLRPQQTTDKRPASTQNKPLISFNSRWTACKWSLFTVIFILFFQRLLLCSRMLLQLDPSQNMDTQTAQAAVAIAEKQVKTTIFMLYSALPYLMGEVDVEGVPLAVPQRQTVTMYHLVWPLAVVMANPYSNPRQVADCHARLGFIRDVYGIKLASFAPALARDLMA